MNGMFGVISGRRVDIFISPERRMDIRLITDATEGNAIGLSAPLTSFSKKD